MMNISRSSLSRLCLACLVFAATAPSALAQDERVGPHVVAATIRPEQPNTATIKRHGLTRGDFTAISKTLPNVEILVPSREVAREARYSDRGSDVRLIGTTSDYAKLHGLELKRGRFLTDGDLKASRSVIVVSSEVAQKLFPFEDPLGRNIRIDKNYFIVVGVFDSKRSEPDTQPHVCIPVTTMRGRLGDNDIQREAGSFLVEKFELSKIEMRIDDPDKIVETADVVKQLLDRRHEDATFQVTIAMESKPPRKER